MNEFIGYIVRLETHLVGKELESRHAKTSSIWRLKPAKRMDSHPAPFPIEPACTCDLLYAR